MPEQNRAPIQTAAKEKSLVFFEEASFKFECFICSGYVCARFECIAHKQPPNCLAVGREATRALRQLSLFCDGDECLDFRHSFVIQGVNAIVRASFAKLFGAGRHIANAMFPEPPVS
jgi:hypothetical protein